MITADLVKKLRDRTSAGMIDCKKALEETNGDIEKAIEILRKRGVASAEQKSGRATNQGIIETYIHTGSRLGAMIEINCETDFVAKTDDFKHLAKELAIQIAAMNPKTISRETVPQSIIDKELEIYREQMKNEGKPDGVIEKIAIGKLDKFFQEYCLVDQAYVRDEKKNVKDVITEIIAKTGENISVKRFVRFQIGEE